MIIDFITIILLALAAFKGYSKGVVLAVLSFLAIIIGLAAAIKLSVVVATYLNNNDVKGKWLSFISFFIVLIIVILLVRLLARFIQKVVEIALMGWADRLAGIVLYAFLYLTIFSVILFYVEKIELIKPTTLQQSFSYPFIKNLGPWVIDNFGKIVPWFKNMFSDLTKFFGNVATEISH